MNSITKSDSRFIESIRIENGNACLLDLHQKRMNAAAVKFNFAPPALQKEWERLRNDVPKNGIFKWRIIYGKKTFQQELISYQRKEIKTLKMVESPSFDYSCKYENRNQIQDLFSKREDCDDVLIVIDGKITDTSYCNIVFEKQGQFFLNKNNLLDGVQSQFLNQKYGWEYIDVAPSSIYDFDGLHLINAMLPLLDVGEILIY